MLRTLNLTRVLKQIPVRTWRGASTGEGEKKGAYEAAEGGRESGSERSMVVVVGVSVEGDDREPRVER